MTESWKRSINKMFTCVKYGRSLRVGLVSRRFGSWRGSPVVLNSLRDPPFSLRQLISLGIRPKERRILVVKAAIAYRAAYEPIARRIIEVDTPGTTTPNPARLQYTNIRRPMFPLSLVPRSGR